MKLSILATVLSLSIAGAAFAQQPAATGSDAILAGPGIAMGCVAR